MRGFDMAMTALALRISPRKPPLRQRSLAPAVDEPDAAWLDRAALSQQRAALVSSLWPEPARQCVAAPVFSQLPAPAVLGRVTAISWPVGQCDARALQARLAQVFSSDGPETDKSAA